MMYVHTDKQTCLFYVHNDLSSVSLSLLQIRNSQLCWVSFQLSVYQLSVYQWCCQCFSGCCFAVGLNVICFL